VGIYYLWWVVELTYWYEVTLYKDRQIIDYVYVSLGAFAYLARVGEWIRVRVVKLRRDQRPSELGTDSG